VASARWRSKQREHKEISDRHETVTSPLLIGNYGGITKLRIPVTVHLIPAQNRDAQLAII
jgi:hypothetical protein